MLARPGARALKRMAAAGITSALLAGADAGARQTAYAQLTALANAGGPASEADVAVAVACVGPLVDDVLCADASVVGAAEYRQASLVLAGLLLLDRLEVGVEYLGHERSLAAWAAPGTALAAMLTKEPVELDVEDGAVILPRPSPSFHVGNPYE